MGGAAKRFEVSPLGKGSFVGTTCVKAMRPPFQAQIPLQRQQSCCNSYDKQAPQQCFGNVQLR